MVTKFCKQCGVLKLMNDFYKNDEMKDGYFSFCKSCICERQKISRKKRLKAFKRMNGLKVCKACGVEKSISNFYKNVGMKNFHANTCAKCARKLSLLNYHRKATDPHFLKKEADRRMERYYRLKNRIKSEQ